MHVDLFKIMLGSSTQFYELLINICLSHLAITQSQYLSLFSRIQKEWKPNLFSGSKTDMQIDNHYEYYS